VAALRPCLRLRVHPQPQPHLQKGMTTARVKMRGGGVGPACERLKLVSGASWDSLKSSFSQVIGHIRHGLALLGAAGRGLQSAASRNLGAPGAAAVVGREVRDEVRGQVVRHPPVPPRVMTKVGWTASS
jgi:hypothetical protein